MARLLALPDGTRDQNAIALAVSGTGLAGQPVGALLDQVTRAAVLMAAGA